jgi:gamma-glutamylcysteine synthetase
MVEDGELELTKNLISNFRRVQYVVCFLLGNSPASEFYMPTFRNTLSVPSS